MSNRVRGRLAQGRRKISAGDASPRFSNDGPALVVAEIGEPLPKRAVRGTVTLVVAVALTLGLLYLVLASTVLAVLGAGDRHAVVLRAAFPQGAAPVGTEVYASSAAAPRDFFSKVEQSFLGVPNGSVVQIVSRPGRRVANGPGNVVVEDGKPTPYTADIKDRLLVREYLALCVSGACGNPGDPVLVAQDNLIGSVKGYVGLVSFERPGGARQ